MNRKRLRSWSGRRGDGSTMRDRRRFLGSPRTLVLEPPDELADGWKNVNTPEELAAEEHFARAVRNRTRVKKE